MLCADNLCVRGHPDIYVVGDVARREHPIYGDLLRIEHWTNAGELGRLAAATITGAPSQAAQLPYVWSELYGRRIQIVGRPALGHLARRYGASHVWCATVMADCVSPKPIPCCCSAPRNWASAASALAVPAVSMATRPSADRKGGADGGFDESRGEHCVGLLECRVAVVIEMRIGAHAWRILGNPTRACAKLRNENARQAFAKTITATCS